MRMLTYYINRGGKNLSESRKRELEKAKELLSEKVKKTREEKQSR
jgi:tRNA(adenine34) deaminase